MQRNRTNVCHRLTLEATLEKKSPVTAISAAILEKKSLVTATSEATMEKKSI